jgi:DNA-binding MarR family transcriptional regulator
MTALLRRASDSLGAFYEDSIVILNATPGLERTAPPTADDAAPEAVAARMIQLLPRLLRLTIAAMHDAPHTAGMTLAQFKILSRLSERDHRAGELAEALEVGGATLTVTADTLERRGLIERVRGLPSDRRAVVLRLTPAGVALHRALKARAIARLADIVTMSDPDERAALALGLAALQRDLAAARLQEDMEDAE